MHFAITFTCLRKCPLCGIPANILYWVYSCGAGYLSYSMGNSAGSQ